MPYIRPGIYTILGFCLFISTLGFDALENAKGRVCWEFYKWERAEREEKQNTIQHTDFDNELHHFTNRFI